MDHPDKRQVALNPMRVTVSAINIGKIVAIGPRRSPTGIFKNVTQGPWSVTSDGLIGDHQGDRKNHGGLEKAIHQYPVESYSAWRAEYPNMRSVLDNGSAFGENLCLPLMTESNVCVGDIYRLGDVVLQVSQGRQPCWKLNLRFGRPDMAWLVQKTGRTGWYYRVIKSGTVQVDSVLELVERPHPDWTIARLNGIISSRCLSRDELSEMATLRHLSNSWRNLAQRRLESACIENWSKRLGQNPET
jgi:MOSC domain-containing protein YiiM